MMTTHPTSTPRRNRALVSQALASVVLLLVVTAATVVLPMPAAADGPIMVTTTNDVVNADDGVLSLREAITVALNDGGPSTIQLAVGAEYLLTQCGLPGQGELSESSGQGLELLGSGSTIRQTCDGAVLSVFGGEVIVRDVVIADGNRAVGGCCAGGAQLHSTADDILVEHVAFLDNHNVDGSGGGGLLATAPQGSVTIRRVVSMGNETTHAGGGMRITTGATIEDTALVGNTAGGSGGGLMVDGPATLRNVTIAGNEALAAGAARLFHTADLRNVTIAGNLSPDGQLRVSQALTLAGTVFADAAVGQDNCLDPIMVSLGSNYSTDSSCDLGEGDTEDGVDPELRPAFDNGGDTMTMYPSKGSVLLDEIGAADPELLDMDQRGVGRPQGTGGDIGAVEVYSCGGMFVDINDAHPFCWEIGWLRESGVTTGFPDDTFRPGGDVTRQSMAAFLYRLAGEPPFQSPGDPSFSDVPLSHPFFDEIEWLATTGITTGFPDATFRPGGGVTRQSLAAFLYRLADEPDFDPPVEASFGDVPLSHPFFAEIEWLASTGITTGFPDDAFRPGGPVTRQSMAAFLYRFVDGQNIRGSATS